MPTEMKLYYNVETNSLNAKYSYDLKYFKGKKFLSSNSFEEWYNEMRK